MNTGDEAREFLMSRRANISPEQAGVAVSGHRRVAGLRRGEVAMLAGVSPVARESLTRALDVIVNGPAFVRNGRMDILATNALGRAFYDEVFNGPGEGNLARYCFLDERARAFYPDWEAAADVTVAILRTEAGHDPRDKQLHDLVGALSTISDEFRTRWGAHNVRRHGSGTKNFHHHEIGDLTLSYDGLELTAEPGLSFLIYTAEPGPPSEQRLQLLASLAATDTAMSPRYPVPDNTTAKKD